MSEQKTLPTDADVAERIAAIPDERKRKDVDELTRMVSEVTGETPVIWSNGMFGFGAEPYRYASGHSGVWPPVAFAPRAANLTLYLSCNLQEHTDRLARLGKHKTGIGCLYIKRLDDVDRAVLRELIAAVHRAKSHE